MTNSTELRPSSERNKENEVKKKKKKKKKKKIK